MDLTITTPPSATSIDVDLVKASKRVRHNSEDALIAFWIGAADAMVEKATNRSLMTQTLLLRIDEVVCEFSLPRPPVASISSIKYTVEGGSEVTLNSLDYVQTKKEMLPFVTIPNLSNQAGSMEIEYIAGVNEMENVPAPLRQASMLLAGHFLTSREAAYMDKRIMDVEKKIQFGFDELCGAFRIPNVTPITVND